MGISNTTSKPFRATLERMPGRLGWTIIRVPKSVANVWGKPGQLRAKGEINGFPLRTSLFPDGRGGHYMLVNKQMQKAARVRAGMEAEFLLQPDRAERPLEMPVELARLLRGEKELNKFFGSLNPSAQRDIARWIAGAKQAETRRRRAEQMAERLLETMEAERELPPMLRLALAGTPGALAAWQNMPPGQRRRELLGIFYYSDPESRARRIAKAIEAMMEHGEK